MSRCPCGSSLPCALADAGYPWCVRCMCHHRHPETCVGVTPDGQDADHPEYREEWRT